MSLPPSFPIENEENTTIPQRGLLDSTVESPDNPDLLVPLCPILSTSETQIGCVEAGCAWFNTMIGACWIADACLALKKIAKVL